MGSQRFKNVPQYLFIIINQYLSFMFKLISKEFLYNFIISKLSSLVLNSQLLSPSFLDQYSLCLIIHLIVFINIKFTSYSYIFILETKVSMLLMNRSNF